MDIGLTRRAMLLGAALFSLGTRAAVAAQAPFGPKVGTKAPDVGPLLDQNGVARTVAELAGSKGIVLMFFRSAAWCPFCQAQLIAMNGGASEFKKRGYNIAALSYDMPRVTKEFADRRAIKFAFLSDPKSAVIDGWGLRDPQYAPSSIAYGVPRPIIFIIDHNGVIRASLAEETYQQRPPVSAVIAAIDAIE